MKKTVFVVGAFIITAFGALAAEPPAADVIKIGMVNDQTGPNKVAGKGMKVGVNAYFKTVNERGGVNGKKIELINADDQYVPDKTVDALLKLIEEQKIFALTSTVGTSNGISIIPIIKEYKLPFVNPRSGAPNFRNPVIHELINIRASHQVEIDKQVDTLIQRGAKRFAVFYQNDAFGVDILTCTENALKRNNLALVAKGSFERGTTAVTSALTAIIAGKPDAVIIGSVSAPGAEFIKAARREGLKVHFTAGSFAGGSNLVKAAGTDAEGIIFTQIVPNVNDVSVPLVKECKETIEKTPEDVGFNSVSLEGCMVAKSMIMALEKAGSPPTQEGFIKAYESMKAVDIGGIQLTLSQDNHQAQSNVYLEIVKDGKLVPMTNLK